jgi:hypothetical protein
VIPLFSIEQWRFVAVKQKFSGSVSQSPGLLHVFATLSRDRTSASNLFGGQPLIEAAIHQSNDLEAD